MCTETRIENLNMNTDQLRDERRAAGLDAATLGARADALLGRIAATRAAHSNAEYQKRHRAKREAQAQAWRELENTFLPDIEARASVAPQPPDYNSVRDAYLTGFRDAVSHLRIYVQSRGVLRAIDAEEAEY
ncbi:MAG: hypothetical protein H7Y38_14510 [Armatimonadetes bacterium]|nr:hypothetical protein [Armatimonadota bacterium]